MWSRFNFIHVLMHKQSQIMIPLNDLSYELIYLLVHQYLHLSKPSTTSCLLQCEKKLIRKFIHFNDYLLESIHVIRYH